MMLMVVRLYIVMFSGNDIEISGGMESTKKSTELQSRRPSVSLPQRVRVLLPSSAVMDVFRKPPALDSLHD